MDIFSNELIHRIADKQLSLVGKDTSTMPDEQPFSRVSDELQNLGVDSEGLIDRLR